MIDGINVMMVTGMLEVIRKQVERGDDHSSIGVPRNLEFLGREAEALSTAIFDAQTDPTLQSLNASRGGP